MNTARDSVVYDYDRSQLVARMEAFCDAYESEVDRFRRKRPDDIDAFVDSSKVKWSRNLKRSLSTEQHLRFDASLRSSRGLPSFHPDVCLLC